ncbi:MAG: glycosyltransferase [Actinomycetota bacterium]|nr:glycosyltransferase [Actinomycetota bacterium]
MASAETTQAAPPAEEVAPYAELAAFFDRFADDEQRWRRRNRTYHRLIEQIFRFQIPRGSRVLEIGSGSGDLLAALEPSVGVGVDVSPGMVALARSRHPGLRFEVAAGEELDLGETFDYVVLSDLMPYVHDVLALLERVAAHSHQRTRIVVNSYSRAWRPIIRLAEILRLKPAKPLRNWVTPHDVRNLLDLAGLEVLTTSTRLLLPKHVPVLTTFANGFLANLWPLNQLCLTYWIVARPQPTPIGERSVSVVCPCRNEAGHVAALVERLPEVGTATELLFVEGGSTDDTRAEIARQIELRPDLDISLVDQPGRGKGDAVRAGFDAAAHDVLMILDGDLSVRPEDLPKFYRALVEGRTELVNGSRLVYDVEPGAMRFLNMVGNRAFSRLFKAVTGHYVKDTLCGTKVLLREDYERIKAGRAYFGEFDPFGDFDLLFGAARLNLKIADLPVRYQPRAYGETNISRWRHGWLLLRMTVFAYWKFKVALYMRRRATR